MKNDDKTFLKIGIVGAFLASLCCLGPLILIALGVGTAGSVLSIGYNKPYFLVGALVFFIVAAWFYFRKKQMVVCDCADGSGKLDNKKIAVQIFIALCAMIALYLLLTFVLVPILAPLATRSTSPTNATQAVNTNNLRHATLAIDGMYCASCPYTVENALKDTSGVVNATVGFVGKEIINGTVEGRGEVVYDATKTNTDKIIQAILPYNGAILRDEETQTTELISLSKDFLREELIK